ncbi:MAG: response regulator [Planctomycetota bacterium]|nr:response regulator [Planctomycetota bacterium]
MSYRILIADDSSDCRRAMAALLDSAGFLVEQAEDGSAALRRLLDTAYDLSLLDMHMPALTGLEVLAQLQHSGVRTPSILMTGHPSRAIEAAALEAGARTMLRKPIPAEILRITVQTIVCEIHGPEGGPHPGPHRA